MKILIVGNIFKDVYLNLDDRAEKFETDSEKVKWLNLSFNSSEHRFFRRNASYGGAAISLEVLSKMGVNAQISGSHANYNNDGFGIGESSAALYRYILVSDEQATYFAPSYEIESVFTEPTELVDYIFIDRSANISTTTAMKILIFLKKHPETKLALYLRKNLRGQAEKELSKHADLIFTELKNLDTDPKKTVLISDNTISYFDLKEKFSITHESLMTHLSAYSIIGATVLGGIAIGEDIPESMILAKTNVENSSLDACLSIEALRELSAEH